MDGIEKEYGQRLRVIRLNLQSPAGRALAGEYGAFSTPTFILLDAQGGVLRQDVGSLRPEVIRQALNP